VTDRSQPFWSAFWPQFVATLVGGAVLLVLAWATTHYFKWFGVGIGRGSSGTRSRCLCCAVPFGGGGLRSDRQRRLSFSTELDRNVGVSRPSVPGPKAMLALLALLLTSCGNSGGGGASSTSAAPNVPYTIELHATREAAQLIRAEGRTKLPDGAVLSLSASRAFRYAHEHDVRAVHAAGDTVTVSGGAFSAVLKLDEGTLVVGLDVDKDDPAIGPIATIDNAVTVCAEFRTGKDLLEDKPEQPSASVRDAVGESGERLEGSPQVTVFGSATPTPSNALEIERRLAMKSPVLDRIIRVQGKRPVSTRLAGFCLS